MFMISENGSQLVGTEQELQRKVRGIGYREVERNLCRKIVTVAVHNHNSPTPEWLCRILG